MSERFIPTEPWIAGIAQPDLVFNNLARRFDLSQIAAKSATTTGQPGSPAERDLYIIPDDATGGQWALADVGDLAFFLGGTWYFFAPTDGMRKYVVDEDANWQFKIADGWAVESGAGGSIESVVAGTGISVDDTDPANPIVSATGGGGGLEIITEGSAFTAESATHSGQGRYIRAGGDVTFDSTETYAEGDVFNIRATDEIELLEDGVTLDPPFGGTLTLSSGMSVTIAMTSSTTGDVIGQTVAA